MALQLLRLSSGADYGKMKMNGEVLDHQVPMTFQQYEKEGEKLGTIIDIIQNT